VSEPIIVSEVTYTNRVETPHEYTYDEILELFPDGDGSLVNPLLRRCQKYEQALADAEARVRELNEQLAEANERIRDLHDGLETARANNDALRLQISELTEQLAAKRSPSSVPPHMEIGPHGAQRCYQCGTWIFSYPCQYCGHER
jgi:hypothetical protein